MTNTDVLECVTTEEVYEETTCLESNCSVPVVHLKSDSLETEAHNLLVGGTYVDTILTALPVSLFDLCFSIFSIFASTISLFLCTLFLTIFTFWGYVGLIRGGAEYNCCNSCSSGWTIWLVSHALTYK